MHPLGDLSLAHERIGQPRRSLAYAREAYELSLSHYGADDDWTRELQGDIKRLERAVLVARERELDGSG